MPELEEKEINLREYLLVIMKRRWMILTIVLLIVTITAIYSFLQTPLYKTSTTMLIDRMNYNIVPEVVSETSSWQGYEAFFQTQYKLLKSKSLALRVAERLDLKVTDIVGPGETKPPKSKTAPSNEDKQAENRAVAGMLLGMIEIVPVKNTTLCEISFTTPDPKLSMVLANTWAEEYREYSLASQYEFTQKAEELLIEQVNGLQAEIAEKERLLQNFSIEKQVVRLDNDRSISSQTLEEINSGITEAAQLRIAKEAFYNQIRSQSPESVAAVTSSSLISQLRGEYANLERQYSDKTKVYKADYPEMVRLKSQMEQTQKRLNQESADLYRKAVEAARADYNQAVNQETALQSKLDSTKRQSIEYNKKEFNYDRLKLEVDNKKQLLESLMVKQSETGVNVQVKEKKATTIRIIDKAEIPGAPFKPNIPKNIWFSLMFGMIAGVGCAFLLEYLDSSLKSSDDVERHVQLPFLGIVPRYMIGADDDDEVAKGKPKAIVKKEDNTNSPTEATDLLTLYNPNSIASEAFKTVRTSLLLSFPEAPPKTILVTSSRPGEGKTFVACNLAISLAQLDKKVILIDADMRNPRVHRVWSMRNDIGLSKFLTSDVPASDVIRTSRIKELRIITSGTKTPRPAELLSSKRLEALIHQLEDQYDHIIIDSPPLMPVADSQILAAKCNCVVMVVHGGVTPRDVVQMAKQKLLKSDAVMAGVVLNYIDLADPYYYYSYYSNYAYRYGQENKPAKFLQ